MNNRKRNELKTAINYLQKAQDIIINVSNTESDNYENLPESFQLSENGEKMESAIDRLEEIEESIDLVIESVEEVIR